jgi:serine/threonine-protein kinase
MGAEPRPVSASVPVAPRSLDHLIARCLAKAPDDRWQTARDVHQELQWVLEQPVDLSTTASVVSTRRWRVALPIAGAALIVGAGAMAILLQPRTDAPAPPAVTRLQAARSPAESIVNPGLSQVAISRDGRIIAFVCNLQELFKVAVGGGRRTPLARFASGAGCNSQRISWSADDWIYYAESTGQLRAVCSGYAPRGDSRSV